MRILLRTSRTAIWARRLGSVAVPLVIISVLLHRFRLITSDLFTVAVFVAGTIGLLALVLSVLALVRLWQSGDQGWSKALAGLFFATISLLPFAWYGSLAVRYPAVTDMATTDRGLMPLVFEPGTAAMPTPKLLSRAEMAAEFPNAETRTYPLGLLPAFGLVNHLVTSNGWDIRLLRETGDVSQLNAQIMTLPGWREEVVIRVTGDATQSTVDMRSASLHAWHDFGDNGLRIESFLASLDDAVTTMLRDNPAANQQLEEAAEAVVNSAAEATP